MTSPYRNPAPDPSEGLLPASQLPRFSDADKCPKCGRVQYHPDKYCRGTRPLAQHEELFRAGLSVGCPRDIDGAHMHVDCVCGYKWSVQCLDAP